MQSADRDTLMERSANLNQAFENAEMQLGVGPYFYGDVMGNVDIAWLPLLHRALIVKQRSGYDFLAKYPKMQAWQAERAEMAETGISEKSVAEDFEEPFSNFYLTPKTFLGRSAFGEGQAFWNLPLAIATVSAVKLFKILQKLEQTQDRVPFPAREASFQIIRRVSL